MSADFWERNADCKREREPSPSARLGMTTVGALDGLVSGSADTTVSSTLIAMREFTHRSKAGELPDAWPNDLSK